MSKTRGIRPPASRDRAGAGESVNEIVPPASRASNRTFAGLMCICTAVVLGLLLPEPGLAHLDEVKEAGSPRLLANLIGALFFFGALLATVVALVWAVRRGQLKQPEETARRLLEGDEEEERLLPYTEFKG